MPAPFFYYGHYLRLHLRDEKQKTYTIFGLSLVTAFIFSVLAIAPTIKTIVETKEEVALLREASQSLTLKISALDKARANYAKAQKYSQLVDSQVHLFEGWGKELNVISSKAQKNNLLVTEISTNAATQGAGADRLVTFKVRGQYPEIKDFILYLEDRQLSFTIESLLFETAVVKDTGYADLPASGLGEGEIEATLDLKVFFL